MTTRRVLPDREMPRTVRQPKLSDVVDVRHAGKAPNGATSRTLAKAETLDDRLLTIPKGREIFTSRARGDITVYHLERWIAGDRTPCTPPGLGRTPGH